MTAIKKLVYGAEQRESFKFDQMSMDKGLFLTTERGMQKGPSGYIRITEGFPKSRIISRPRIDPKQLPMRLFTRVLRMGAVSRYFRWGSFRCEWAARGFCRVHRPDFVHLIWGDQDWGYLDWLLPRETPLIATFHNPEPLLWKGVLCPSRLDRFDHLILMSPCQGSFFREAGGLSDERMTFIPHGIDTAAFVPGQTSARPGSGRPFTLLHVGSYLRNFALLEKLAENLSGDDSVKLRIIGPADLKAAYPGLNKARYESNLDSPEFLKAYQEADCLLMTVEDATANNAILEGMACGLPIICEENPSIREYTGPDAAIFSERDNLDSMLACVRRLQQDDGLQADMGRASRQRAEALSWEKLHPEVVRVYEKAAARRAALCGTK